MDQLSLMQHIGKMHLRPVTR